MKTNVKTTNIEMTPEIADYVEKRVSTFDTFIEPDDTTAICDVEIGRTTEHHQKGNVFRAEIQVSSKGNLFRGVSEKEKLYDAIDEARREVKRELRRHKNKNLTLLRRGGASVKKWLRGFS